MHRWVFLCALVVCSTATAETFRLTGFAAARGVVASGHSSWMRGGFGRFDAGGAEPDRDSTDGFAELQLGADWQPLRWLTAHAHGLARAEPRDFGGKRAGLVSAYLEANLDRGRNDWRIRAGQFFLGTSRENIGPLWTSPYMLTDSALNGWIAQEVRPIGIDVQWQTLMPSGVLTAAATAFRGNDTMGTVLAWRGWTVGNRLSVYDETLPLPPLSAFREFFRKQRHGTTPFTRDLDGRTGWSARVRYAVPERLSISAARVDNRGDRALHGNEYAWATRFDVFGADAHLGRAMLAAEAATGKTGMGFHRPAAVDTDFYAAYLLGSFKEGRNRFSARYDIFHTDTKPYVAGEDEYSEHGRAWTLTWLFDWTAAIRSGVEFTQATGTHLEAADAGFDPTMDGRSVTLELRYTLR